LINDAWCDFIGKWKVNLGLSIDGPAEFHDLNRKYRNGSVRSRRPSAACSWCRSAAYRST